MYIETIVDRYGNKSYRLWDLEKEGLLFDASRRKSSAKPKSQEITASAAAAVEAER